MKLRILASSHYLQPIHDGQPEPSLDEALAAVCREKFRRIDRFIQLALLGSGRCAPGQALGSSCGLYLASATGQVSNNVAVQETLLRSGLLPKPFHFVNTLGSAAGYYVARNLQMTGQNLFVSRDESSFEAALELAAGDLEAGHLEQALLGVVEECPQPLAHQRARLFAAPERELAEGSHWLLLEKGEPSSGQAGVQIERFGDRAALDAALKGAVKPGDTVKASAQLGADTAWAFHKCISGAVVLGFLTSKKGPEALHLIQGSDAAGWVWLRFQ